MKLEPKMKNGDLEHGHHPILLDCSYVLRLVAVAMESLEISQRKSSKIGNDVICTSFEQDFRPASLCNA